MLLKKSTRTVSVVKNTTGCLGYRLTPGVGYIVRLFNDELGKPNMSDKPMRIVRRTKDTIELRGYRVEAQTPHGWREVDYGDYGLTIRYSGGQVSECVLHMFDRDIDIAYYKEIEEEDDPIDEGQAAIINLATRLNLAYNLGASDMARQLCSMLRREVHLQRQGGRSLINLPSSECQCVGLAFTTMALYYDAGDKDINSVAAENAYYLLARSLVECSNAYVAPAIYTLMQDPKGLMNDKLISSFVDMWQRKVGMPIGLIFGGNPFIDPDLEDFRKDAISIEDNISYYALTKFYDTEKGEYKIPTNLPHHIPEELEIQVFLARMNFKPSFQDEDFLADCEAHFLSVYEQCKETLLKY